MQAIKLSVKGSDTAHAMGWGLVAAFAVIAGIYFGSRGLRDFDPALVSYAGATVFAAFGLGYRYAMWLRRPPTRVYWFRGWQIFLNPKKLPANIGHLLKNSIRLEDEAYRWGGDEFVVLFHKQKPEVARARMVELEARLRDFRVRGFGVLPISFSWGVTDARGRELRDALDEADRSMYLSKRARVEGAREHPPVV